MFVRPYGQKSPGTDAETLILGELARKGLRYEQHGNGWRVFGNGVDVRVGDLAHLTTADLKPATCR